VGTGSVQSDPAHLQQGHLELKILHQSRGVVVSLDLEQLASLMEGLEVDGLRPMYQRKKKEQAPQGVA
jgi:hypothetical protein